MNVICSHAFSFVLIWLINVKRNNTLDWVLIMNDQGAFQSPLHIYSLQSTLAYQLITFLNGAPNNPICGRSL